MDKLHGNRAFTDAGSDAFHRAMPHIAHCEKAWNIGLEQEGIPIERPALRTLAVSYEIRPREYEAAFWDPLESTCRHASLSIL